MFRRSTVVLAIAAAAMTSAASGTATATVVSPEDGPIARVELDLAASNGVRAHLETSEKEMVTLTLRRRHSSVVYEAPGEVSETGLNVRFGRLGLIDVTFAPTTTLDSTAPSAGCTGPPRTLREGVFTGTIDFTGERDYARLEGPQATGSMSVISQWECPDNPFAPFKGPLRRAARSKANDETASLVAIGADLLRFFGAGVHHRHSGGKSIFYGATYEKREGMEISRVTSVRGRPGAFNFNHEAGTASLHPPPPLQGHATYRRGPEHPLWRSTIRVPLLGAPDLRLGGREFGVELYPEYQFD